MESKRQRRWVMPVAIVVRVALGAAIGGGLGYVIGAIAGDIDLWITLGLVVGCANAGTYNPTAATLGAYPSPQFRKGRSRSVSPAQSSQ